MAKARTGARLLLGCLLICGSGTAAWAAPTVSQMLGTDTDQDGKIDAWRMVSAEEASQEIFQAVLTNDFPRLQALWITDAELKALGLPAAEVARIHGLQEKAQEKFQNTVHKLDLG